MKINEENNFQNYPKNIIYVNKLNYEIQNLESSYIKEHYNIKQINEKEINKILEQIRIYKKRNIKPDNIFWKKLHKLSTRPGGFISIKNRREIYSFILDILSQKPEFKIISTKVTQDQINSYDTIIKNDCKRSVLYSLIKNNDKFKKYQKSTHTLITYIFLIQKKV